MSKHEGRQMTNAEDVRSFALAGNARLTLVSKKSKTRFSYRVRLSDNGELHFVSVLTGSDNEDSYSYLGIIRNDAFRRTAKSRIGEDAPSYRAFVFFWKMLSNSVIHHDMEVWHEGKCGRCGRALTVPESIERGIGPECYSRMGG